MTNPTSCTQCGHIITVRDGVAYTPGSTARHSCTQTNAPRTIVPEWIRDSVEYQAFTQLRVAKA